MRAAYERATANSAKRTVQIGHQGCSSGQVTDASNYLASGDGRSGDGDSRAHVPEHAAWEAAMGAPGLSGHDA